ncbi:hypothetical protein [Sphingomonas glaciei]|uniref:Uncharacterized protein n=1 Tax=Sphingomonas glaciei TaxID=2938948 RepID=A0ABY5MSU5_9SPHN|nr:hypothetical protein [Sphingomonas glaciei]UUR07580.1 hypothetical protein M1K48_11650 [Sphingomonas glaciei]
MAGIQEMALGIASVLRSGSAPNPLPVDLWGYAPDDGADFLRHLADECADADIAVQEMWADPAFVHQLTRSKTETGSLLRGISITADPDCQGRIEVVLANS